MAMNGKNIIIYVGGEPVAATRSNEIQCGCELIEISSPDSNEWREYIAGRKEWSLSIGWLVTTHSDLTKLLTVGTTVSITIGTGGGGGGIIAGLYGTAIVQSCKLTATVGNLAQGGLQLKGTGELVDATPTPPTST